MTERWRSAAARDLAKAVRAAGGTIERVGVGRIRVAGPNGSVTLHEPGTETRRDLGRSKAAILIEEHTGLDLTGGAR
ncbi:MAG TPA: hypothetical protein DGT23_18730 [Micromonosporaceae bacterium]|nr:hypothetical protein [Micromonosporaceae bacterium]